MSALLERLVDRALGRADVLQLPPRQRYAPHDTVETEADEPDGDQDGDDATEVSLPPRRREKRPRSPLQPRREDSEPVPTRRAPELQTDRRAESLLSLDETPREAPAQGEAPPDMPFRREPEKPGEASKERERVTERTRSERTVERIEIRHDERAPLLPPQEVPQSEAGPDAENRADAPTPVHRPIREDARRGEQARVPLLSIGRIEIRPPAPQPARPPAATRNTRTARAAPRHSLQDMIEKRGR